MIVTISGELRIKDATPELLSYYDRKLTVDNPKYISALRMGFATFGIPQTLRLYHLDHGELCLPRGLWDDLRGRLPEDTRVIRRLVLLPRVSFPRMDIQLRGYQHEALDAVLRSGRSQGVIVAPCGAGKTETALRLIARLGQPALWITHTVDLVEQVLDRTRLRLGLDGDELGTIGAGKMSIGTRLTAATVQTLYRRDLDEIAGCFGTVIVDECHRVVNNPEKASMFAEVLACLPAHYRYGITASPSRGDGLGETIWHVMGGELAHIDRADVEQAGGTLRPVIQPIYTRFRYEPAPDEQPVDFNRLQRYIARDAERTAAVQHIASEAIRDGRHVLILASHLDVLERLQHGLVGEGHRAELVSGKTAAKPRGESIGAFRDGTLPCLLATYGLAKEGLDAPPADTLILASPVRNAVAVQQAIGRICRPCPGKPEPVVYDFVDREVSICKSQYYSRRSVYKTLGAQIEKEIQL